MMKATMQSPTSEQTVEDGDLELQARVQHQRKGRIQSVEFHFDKKTAGTYQVDDLANIGTIANIPFAVTDAPIGVHTAWAKATDTSKNTQTTDTVTFFVGQSELFDGGTVENGDQKGGTVHWGTALTESGKYRLAFKYSSPAFRGTEVRLDGDSITKSYFYKNANAYQTIDIEIAQSGSHVLQLTATGITGLPDITSLRVFPLEGQAVPSAADLTGISSQRIGGDDDMLEIYSLSGVFVRRMPQSQLGISLGTRSSAVVTLPRSALPLGLSKNCVGGTPYIVRKQRLK